MTGWARVAGVACGVAARRAVAAADVAAGQAQPQVDPRRARCRHSSHPSVRAGTGCRVLVYFWQLIADLQER